MGGGLAYAMRDGACDGFVLSNFQGGRSADARPARANVGARPPHRGNMEIGKMRVRCEVGRRRCVPGQISREQGIAATWDTQSRVEIRLASRIVVVHDAARATCEAGSSKLKKLSFFDNDDI